MYVQDIGYLLFFQFESTWDLIVKGIVSGLIEVGIIHFCVQMIA